MKDITRPLPIPYFLTSTKYNSAFWRKAYSFHNPPDKYGFYECWLCGELLSFDEMTIDHVFPRDYYPEFQNKYKNMKPACSSCNGKRGKFKDLFISNPERALRSYNKHPLLEKYLLGVAIIEPADIVRYYQAIQIAHQIGGF